MKCKFIKKNKKLIFVLFLAEKLTFIVLVVSVLLSSLLQQCSCQLLESAEQMKQLRQWSPVLKQYEPLVERYGSNMVNFLLCMGYKWAQNCVTPTITCAAVPNPVGCIALIVCEGVNTVICASKHFFNKTLDAN